MPIGKSMLFLLLTTYLSGTFTLDRLNIGINIEVRYLLFVLLITLILLGVSRRKEKLLIRYNKSLFIIFFVMLLYIFMCTISLYYSSSQLISLEKFLSNIFLTALIIATIFTIGLIKPNQFFNYIAVFFITIGFIYSIPVFMSVLSGASRGDATISGPNVTTRIFFFALCSSLFLYTLNKKNLYFITSIIFIVSIVLVGSRGGLVGGILTVLVLFIVKVITSPLIIKKNISLTYRQLLLIPIALTFVYFAYKPVKKVIVERIIGATFQKDGDIYSSGRDILYEKAIWMIKEKPLFGHGLNGFTIKTGEVYPHNLLLEMMVEIGFIGAFIFLAFFCLSLFIIFKMRNSSLFILTGLPLYMIIVQMFSGEFYDFRYFFLWLIPLISFHNVSEVELIKTGEGKIPLIK